MKVKDLIKKLELMPQNLEVCIMDWRKNLHHADDDFNGKGIEPHFEVMHLTKKDDVNKPFVALLFMNDDYNSDGTPDFDSSICYLAMKEANQ